MMTFGIGRISQINACFHVVRKMTRKPHLSPSSIDQYCRCPESWRRRYIERDKTPPALAMIRGTGVHGGIMENFQQKIDSHEDLPKSAIRDLAVSHMDGEVSERGYSLSAEEASVGASQSLGAIRDSVATLAEFHAKEQAPDYQPVKVEEGVTIEIPNASHNLFGYLDMLDDRNRVTDFKTTGKRKNQQEVDASTALTFYSAGAALLNEKPAAEVRFDVIVALKKGPVRQVIDSDRGVTDYRALVHRFNAVLAGIAAGNFPPATPGAWWCSPKWCGYWRTCPYVNSERLVKIS